MIDNAAVSWITLDGERYLVEAMQYDDMTIAAYLPQSEYSASLLTMLVTNSIVGVITIFALLFALFFCIHRLLLKPIQELSGNLRMIQQGRISETNVQYQSWDSLPRTCGTSARA